MAYIEIFILKEKILQHINFHEILSPEKVSTTYFLSIPYNIFLIKGIECTTWFFDSLLRFKNDWRGSNLNKNYLEKGIKQCGAHCATHQQKCFIHTSKWDDVAKGFWHFCSCVTYFSFWLARWVLFYKIYYVKVGFSWHSNGKLARSVWS